MDYLIDLIVNIINYYSGNFDKRICVSLSDEPRTLSGGIGHNEVGGRAQGDQDYQAARADGGGQAGLCGRAVAPLYGAAGEQRLESPGHGD